MGYNKFKDLEKRTKSGIVLKNKALKIFSNPKYNGDERGCASMVYNFFYKKSKGSGLKKIWGSFYKIHNKLMNFMNQLLESSNKEKFILLLRTIFGVLILQLISKHNKGIRYLLCVIDLFSKYA